MRTRRDISELVELPPPGLPVTLPAHREYVAGRWSTPALTSGDALHDASSGAAVTAARASDEPSIERALAAAVLEYQRGWGATPARVRAEALLAAAARIERCSDELARIDAISTGVVIAQTRAMAAVAARCFRAAAELAVERNAIERLDGDDAGCEIERLGRGPAVVIAPWNAPTAIAAHKVASALAAGCPVVLKPSEHAPISAQILVEAAAAALPAAALQLVHGDGAVGARLVADLRVAVVSFTGGLVGGRAVATACAQQMKPVQLELGGSNPFLVLAGADLDAAADAVVLGLTTLNGQWCRAIGRIIVERAISAPLLVEVIARLSRLRVGSATAASSQMGPQAHAAQLASVRRAITRLTAIGGEMHAPTPMPSSGGYFVAPTIISGLPAARARDEIFGPVATWHDCDNGAHAAQLASDSPYGLASYVFGPDEAARAVARRLRVGMVSVNRIALTSAHPRAVRPAWGLSGLGDEGTIETFEHFRGARVTTSARFANRGQA